MADVFISYSRANQAQVAVLADAMTRDGFEVWWDAELPPHRSYGDVITEQIAAASAVIVVWSETAAASEWVRAEADLGRNQRKLIQASLDDCMPPMPFNQIQFAYIGDWRGEAGHGGWRKIRASLNELCGRAPSSSVASPPAPPREPAAERKRSYAVPALAAGAVIAAGAVGFMLWNGGGADETPVSEPVEQVAATGGDTEARPTARFNLAAVIDDPDGFSNVRDGPSASARILTRVDEGEAFTTFEQSGGWWQVRTADGTVGWMNRKLIRTLAADKAAPSADDSPPASDPTFDEPAVPSDLAPIPTASGEQILPGSSDARLDEAALAGLSRRELYLARNEIYARRGRRFARPDLRAHFEQFDWYVPVDRPTRLSAIEQANVALIARAEQSR